MGKERIVVRFCGRTSAFAGAGPDSDGYVDMQGRSLKLRDLYIISINRRVSV